VIEDTLMLTFSENAKRVVTPQRITWLNVSSTSLKDGRATMITDANPIHGCVQTFTDAMSLAKSKSFGDNRNVAEYSETNEGINVKLFIEIERRGPRMKKLPKSVIKEP